VCEMRNASMFGDRLKHNIVCLLSSSLLNLNRQRCNVTSFVLACLSELLEQLQLFLLKWRHLLLV